MIADLVALILAVMAAVSAPANPDPLERALVFAERSEAAAQATRDFERRPDPEPVPASEPVTGESGPSRQAWAALRACESGGDYSIDTGNGYFGAYQFNLSTWASYGPAGNPALASPAEQDRRALALYEDRGAQPWPVCGRHLED